MATIELPEKVQIGSQLYEVRVTDMNDSGGLDEFAKILRVNIGHPNIPAVLLSYCHEGIHGIEEEYSVRGLDDDMVDRLAQGFVQLILALVAAQ